MLTPIIKINPTLATRFSHNRFVHMLPPRCIKCFVICSLAIQKYVTRIANQQVGLADTRHPVGADAANHEWH
jgi:hypothetical protein